MASVVHNKKNGTRRIQFVNPEGERKSISLGKVPVKVAQSFKLRVEALLKARITGYEWDSELAQWVAGRPNAMHKRLEGVGLVPPRRADAVVLLRDLVARCEAASSVKASTRAVHRQSTGSLIEYFGEDKPLKEITSEHAAAWRKELLDTGLAIATVSKRVHVARLVFRRAVKWGLLPSSPFADVKPGSQSNPDRQRYVSPEDVEIVLEACPDTEWQAIVGLARLAGLRCPSETMLLRWQDVNWERRRLLVRSPKTAGHEGHAERIVPLVPRLNRILIQLFDEADDGAEFVVERHRNKSCNLRTTFRKIVVRAGLVPWPRLFQNMRASAACDWAERFPGHTVAKWCGHSPIIAVKHYLQTRDAHFEEASSIDLWSGAESCARDSAEDVQHRTAPNRTPPKESSEVLTEYDVMRNGAGSRGLLRSAVLGDTGLEPVTPSV